MKSEWMEELKESLHRMKWNWNTVRKNRKYGLLARMVFVIAAIGFFAVIGIRESCRADSSLQESIASEIIRFHVIANSDLDQDQEVKMKVKDAVIIALRPKMAETSDIAEARSEIQKNLGLVEEIATATLRENGYYYDASATLTKEQFPVKVYGDITLPAGEYEALCIRLGASEGHNWWCIVFPSLCYVDETYSYIPEDSKEQLKQVLTEEEYDEITEEDRQEENSEDGIEVKVKFKLWDYLKKYFE